MWGGALLKRRGQELLRRLDAQTPTPPHTNNTIPTPAPTQHQHDANTTATPTQPSSPSTTIINNNNNFNNNNFNNNTTTHQSILVSGKPHMGTENLVRLLKRFRSHLIALGVDVRFGAAVKDLVVGAGGRAAGVELEGAAPAVLGGGGLMGCRREGQKG